ncbi:MAG TPA: alanine--glyoxylate aminotransferase family protein, partial [Bacillota bacterium]|nr:alanine--glyoxylate aminotransferase family protein [Bacillota bacterium]
LAPDAIAAPTLTTVLHVEGTDDAAFRAALAKKGMIVAGALASLAGKAFRIGHMGSTTPEMLEKAVLYIGEAMEELGMKVDKRNAVDTFRKTYKA